MRNCFLLLLFIQFTSTIGWTQIEIENQCLIEPSLKVLYSGVENKIVLTHIKKKCTYNLLSSDPETTITRLSNTEYSIKPSYSIRMDTLRIVEDSVEIRSDFYTVSRVPIPFIQLGNIHYESKYASANDIIANTTLTPVYFGFLKQSIKIDRFDIHFYDLNDTLLFSEMEVEGNKLTPDLCQRIQALKPGCQIEISNIMVLDERNIGSRRSGVRLILI